MGLIQAICAIILFFLIWSIILDIIFTKGYNTFKKIYEKEIENGEIEDTKSIIKSMNYKIEQIEKKLDSLNNIDKKEE